MDTAADPATQLGGRRFGEGHHQDLGHRQGADMGGGHPLRIREAMAQQQPQIEAG